MKGRRTKIFLDTEFIENGRHEPVRLISLGLITNDGREYYVENSEVDLSLANDWVKTNVLPHLRGPRKTYAEIRQDLLGFVGMNGKDIEFWGYFSDYDWVLFAQIFGTMIQMPQNWPHMCLDLKQWALELGVKQDKFPPDEQPAHNALADARWNLKLYQYLEQVERDQRNASRAGDAAVQTALRSS